MANPDALRDTKIPLAGGSGAMPALGFGTLIPDPVVTGQATKAALEVGFRHLDCSERYRNEAAVGEAMQEVFKAGGIRRETSSSRRTMEQQPSSRAGSAGLRGKSATIATRPRRLLSHPHPVCVSAWR